MYQFVFVCVIFFIQADKSAADADKAVANVDKTHKRAKELDSQIKSALKAIKGEGNFQFSATSVHTQFIEVTDQVSVCLQLCSTS